jgi:hypothetical protein
MIPPTGAEMTDWFSISRPNFVWSDTLDRLLNQERKKRPSTSAAIREIPAGSAGTLPPLAHHL